MSLYSACLFAQVADSVYRAVKEPTYLNSVSGRAFQAISPWLAEDSQQLGSRASSPTHVLALRQLQEKSKPGPVLWRVHASLRFKCAVGDRCGGVFAVLVHRCVDGIFFGHISPFDHRLSFLRRYARLRSAKLGHRHQPNFRPMSCEQRAPMRGSFPAPSRVRVQSAVGHSSELSSGSRLGASTFRDTAPASDRTLPSGVS